MIFIILWRRSIFFPFKTSQQNSPFGLVFKFFLVSPILSEVAEEMALLSQLPPGTPNDVLAMWVLPLISVWTPSWPLSTQGELTCGPTRAAVTFGWHGSLLPGFGGDRAANWGHLLCPGTPAATASHRAGRKGFSTHWRMYLNWSHLFCAYNGRKYHIEVLTVCTHTDFYSVDCEVKNGLNSEWRLFVFQPVAVIVWKLI